MSRVIYLHGNQTTHWSFAWAAAVQTDLQKLGYETVFETLPDSIIAREEYWLPFLADHLHAGQDDVLIGWSSGAVATMRYAETHRIAGSVLVAPSCTDLGDEFERSSGYFDRPWNWQAIRQNQNAIHLVTAADDPYIPQEEFDTIANELKAVRFHSATGGHFIERTAFPQVVECVQALTAS